MNIKKILSDNMFAAFFSLCSVILAESAIFRCTGNCTPLAVGITSLIAIVVTVIFYLNRKHTATYIGTAAVIVITFWVLHTADVPVSEFFVRTAEHFFVGRTLKTGETVFVTSVISLLFSAVMFPVMRIRQARYITALASLALVVYYGILQLPADFTEVFSFAGIILAVLSELCLRSTYKKEISHKLNGVLSFLLPWFVLFSLFVALLPSSDKPISWQFIINIASGIGEKCELLINDIGFFFKFGSSEFNINMQGYSDADNVFGGGFSSESSNQLNITFMTRLNSSVYLIGNVNDTYTGDGWIRDSNDKFSENDSYLDYCEAMLAFEREGYTKEQLNDFTAKTSVEIVYDDIITKTMFYPLKTCNISHSDKYDASLPSITFNKRKKKGDLYDLVYLEIDYCSDQMIKTLERPFSYDQESGINGHSLDSNIPDNIEDTLSKRAGYIKKTYTTLPDDITDRTYDLADNITENCISDYEKLRAIEAYLKGYTYTKTPGDVPDGHDPVDYFLFESGEGYCTYFASAMAVLARCEGIPVRYVQGFIVDKAKMKSLRDQPVAGSQAHAWTEAYIEGVGWIPFEPTAAYNGTRYSYQGRQADTVTESDWNKYKYPDKNDIPDPDEIIAENKKDGNALLYIIVPCTAMSGIALLVILYIVIKIRIFIKRYRVGTYTEKFIICYRIILYLCEKNKHKRQKGETIDNFAARFSDMMPDEKISFIQITSVFDRIRYGGNKASVTETGSAEEFVRDMFMEIKENRSKVSAFMIFVSYCLKQ